MWNVDIGPTALWGRHVQGHAIAFFATLRLRPPSLEYAFVRRYRSMFCGVIWQVQGGRCGVPQDCRIPSTRNPSPRSPALLIGTSFQCVLFPSLFCCRAQSMPPLRLSCETTLGLGSVKRETKKELGGRRRSIELGD